VAGARHVVYFTWGKSLSVPVPRKGSGGNLWKKSTDTSMKDHQFYGNFREEGGTKERKVEWDRPKRLS